MVKLGLLLGLLASLALLATLTTAPAFAGGVVANCSNDTDFSNQLAGCGTLTFNCGAATINLTRTKIIGGNVVIDGGNQITLRGSCSYRHLVVNASASLDHATIRNSVGSLRGGAFEFVPCAGAPPKPVLLTPSKNSQITTPQVLLDRSGPDCAKTYSVVVRQGSKTGTIVYTKSKLKASEATTPALHAHKKYFWQVTVSGAHGSAVSVRFKFKLN